MRYLTRCMCFKQLVPQYIFYNKYLSSHFVDYADQSAFWDRVVGNEVNLVDIKHVVVVQFLDFASTGFMSATL